MMNLIKLNEQLNKIFTQRIEPFNKESLSKKELKLLKGRPENIIFLDPVCVCGITFYDKKMINWFNVNFETEIRKTPKLKYRLEKGEKKLEICSRYSIDYFKKIMDVLSFDSDLSFKLSIKRDYPARFDLEYIEEHTSEVKEKILTIILAPRILE